MATLQEVRNKANAKLADMWPRLQSRQDAYFAKHGKYFQLVASSPLTQDGEDTTFTPTSPSDEQHTIDIDYAWSETVPFQIEIHEWVGALSGYRGIVTVSHEGALYRRERDSDNTDTGWYLVVTTP